jgi:hypothetical protein
VNFIFSTAGSADIALNIFNHQGRCVFSDSWRQELAQDKTTLCKRAWNLKNSSGQLLSTGAYLAVLTVKAKSGAKREETKFDIIK